MARLARGEGVASCILHGVAAMGPGLEVSISRPAPEPRHHPHPSRRAHGGETARAEAAAEDAPAAHRRRRSEILYGRLGPGEPDPETRRRRPDGRAAPTAERRETTS